MAGLCPIPLPPPPTGLLSGMVISFPSAATFWTVYQSTKHWIGARLDPASPWSAPLSHIAAASVADVVVCVVRNPFEVVKQQLQVGMHRSTVGAVRDIVRADGVRGLYAGLASTIARDVPFDALQFLMYEHLKAKVAAERGVCGVPHRRLRVCRGWWPPQPAHTRAVPSRGLCRV